MAILHLTDIGWINPLYLIAALCTVYVTYYLSLHPLRKYPGPFLAKISSVYGLYYASKRRLFWKTYQGFNKYGPVYRLAPNRLVFNSATAAQDIFLNPRTVKGQVAYRAFAFENNLWNVISTFDKEQHKRKRKVIWPLLNERSLRMSESKISSRVNQFLRIISSGACQKKEKVIDIKNPVGRLTVDIVGDVAFGYSFDTQTDPKYRFFLDSINSSMWLLHMFQQSPNYRRVMQFFAKGRPAKRTLLRQAVKEMATKRLAADKAAHHDLYSFASKEGAADEEFMTRELWTEANGLIIAGGGTSATAICSTLFYLTRYAVCYATLAEEVRSTFKSASEIRHGPQLGKCKYLRACIEEALRCSPPVPSLLWKQQDPNDVSGEPYVVDGHVIPPGVEVAVPLYSLFHNEDIFPDPFLYSPERWLPPRTEKAASESGKSTQDAMRKSLIPFALGDRACAGKPLAWLEMSLTIARIIWHFDFARAKGDDGRLGEKLHYFNNGRRVLPEFVIRDIYVTDFDGLNLRFWQRQAVPEEENVV